VPPAVFQETAHDELDDCLEDNGKDVILELPSLLHDYARLRWRAFTILGLGRYFCFILGFSVMV